MVTTPPAAGAREELDVRDLRVADDVARLLGAEYVAKLRRGPAPARARCVICQVAEDLATTTMTVLVAPSVDNARVMFAHPRCAPSGLLPPGPGPLAGQLRTRTAIYGLALTVDGGPPVWVVETDIAVHRDTAGGEVVDELLATLLGLGFALVPVLDGPVLAGLPVLTGWTARLTGGGHDLLVADGGGEAIYDGGIGDVPAGWLGALVTGRRLALLATSMTGLAAADPVAGLVQAARDGRLAGGLVPAGRARSHRA